MLSRRLAAVRPCIGGRRRVSGSAEKVKESQKEPFHEDDEFRVLTTVWPTNTGVKGQREERTVPPWRKNVPRPRSLRMSTDQDWKSVWPTARMFHPAVVPLPVHMGYVRRRDRYAPPDKWANAELMKIPNFLHLAPPAIKAHCKVLQQFCTPWPKELINDEECFKHFPLEYVFTDYVHAAPTIRDVRARVVRLQFQMSDLPMDYHAKDKLKRLLNAKETRYDENTDMVTIVADRCPLKMQNYDYINYLLTACFFESWVSFVYSDLRMIAHFAFSSFSCVQKKEAWEEEKQMSDWERYYFDKSPCLKHLVEYLKKVEKKDSLEPQEVLDRSDVKMYGQAVSKLFDEGESEETIDDYKDSVLKLLFKEEQTQVEDSRGNSRVQKDDQDI